MLDTRAAVLTVGTLLVALAASLVLPATSYWPLLLLLLVDNVAPTLRRGPAVAPRRTALDAETRQN